MTLKIDSFKNEFGFLSNFYEAPIYVNGKRYASVEHAYQAHKTLNESAHNLIRVAKTPGVVLPPTPLPRTPSSC
jgi:predicted NAD-dependent protein-ADP-ribosyltransferase YbiA (DUF1768 family)